MLAKNSLRRNLNQSQRAKVAHRISALSKRGRPRKEPQDGEHHHRTYTQVEAGELLGVSRREVGHAARIYAPDSGIAPEVLRAVEQGKIAAPDVIRVIGEAQDIQREGLARVRRGDAKTMSRKAGQERHDPPGGGHTTPGIRASHAGG